MIISAQEAMTLIRESDPSLDAEEWVLSLSRSKPGEEEIRIKRGLITYDPVTGDFAFHEGTFR